VGSIQFQSVREKSGTETTGGVRALDRGLQLIKCFDAGHPTWRVPDLARAVNLHRATVHRLIKTLEAESFLAFDPDAGEYRLGSALMPIAYLVRSHEQLAWLAQPYLEQLAAQTEETVGLSVWTDQGIVQVTHVPTINFFKPDMPLGSVSTTYGTSHSKLYLAFGPEERLSKLSFGDRGRTLTLAEATKVQEELQRVRETGIAYDIEERTKGVCAVGAPLRDGTGEAFASIAVIVPTERFDPTAKETITNLVREAGASISRGLGFRS